MFHHNEKRTASNDICRLLNPYSMAVSGQITLRAPAPRGTCCLLLRMWELRLREVSPWPGTTWLQQVMDLNPGPYILPASPHSFATSSLCLRLCPEHSHPCLPPTSVEQGGDSDKEPELTGVGQNQHHQEVSVFNFQTIRDTTEARIVSPGPGLGLRPRPFPRSPSFLL